MKKIVIVVGHTPASPGAANQGAGETEFTFNNTLAPLVASALRLRGFAPVIVYRGNSYSGLPDQINDQNAVAGIELHCNAYNTRASGSEVIAWHSSTTGNILGEKLLTHTARCLGLKDRGVKKTEIRDGAYYVKGTDTPQRGGLVLHKTNCPYVIYEPFFIDNPADYAAAKDKLDLLAIAIANAFEEALR